MPRRPLLLRGEHLIEDADGNVHRTSRPVSAVCRCGKSASQPWCDGTHKVIPRSSEVLIGAPGPAEVDEDAARPVGPALGELQAE